MSSMHAAGLQTAPSFVHNLFGAAVFQRVTLHTYPHQRTRKDRPPQWDPQLFLKPSKASVSGP
jgi:hypothetical protein